MTESDIKSDITGNIAADCCEPQQKQEMIDLHEAGCTCAACCESSDSNCQDNLDRCEETKQPTERRKKMKSRLRPVLVNCAVLLSIIGLSGITAHSRIRPIASIDGDILSTIRG